MTKPRNPPRFTPADIRKLTCSVAAGVAKTGVKARITLDPAGKIVIVMGSNVEEENGNEWADLE